MFKLNNCFSRKENKADTILENYKPKYRNRVYYGSVCNYCFDAKIPLKQCSQCSAVSYCSKEHQRKDWKFHKPTCIAIKEVKKKVAYPKECNVANFHQYKLDILDEMIRYRNLESCRDLSLYEIEICLLPRVCAICYSYKVKIDCQKCLSVSYCSEKHRLLDKAVHRGQCQKLELCRILNSLGFENGFKLTKAIHHVYQPINRKIRQFPQSLSELGALIQNETREAITEDEFINLTMFLDPFAPAAFIIHLLEESDCVRKRYFKSKFPTREKGKSGLQKKNSTMTIHFGVANCDELLYEWDKIARLLTDWFINVDKVQIILVGPFLKNMKIPEYDDNNFELIVYPVCYYEAKDLPIPDIVVFFEWQRLLDDGVSQILFTEAQLEAIFKYENVPVVFSSGAGNPLNDLYNLVIKKKNIDCITMIKESFFTKTKCYRYWSRYLFTYTNNQFYSIYMTC